MPDISRWREDAAYAYFDDLDAEGLAWECLRRNASYQAEINRLVAQADGDTAADDACRRHWGLRFRDRPDPYRVRHHHILGTGSRPERRTARDVPTYTFNRDSERDDVAAR